MIIPISQSEFSSAFKLNDKSYYDDFVEKISKELTRILHPAANITDLSCTHRGEDAGGNVHVMLQGSARIFDNVAQIGGEIVWLVHRRSFRGKLWSALANPSDIELLMRARDSFRDAKFDDANNYLCAIRQPESMPRWSRFLKKLILESMKTSLLSEDVLAQDWIGEEEDEAWRHLQSE